MSKEKQIIEIKECIDNVYGADCAYFDVDGFAIANEIYSKGYRRQSEGEWLEIPINNYDGEPSGLYYVCSVCHTDNGFEDKPFCPNCGAKMFVRMTHACPHNIPNLIPTIEEMKGGAE
jgi:DNA-directed RNA polymerase subunit RPC12/RpoP